MLISRRPSRAQADPKSYKDQIMSERRKFYEHVDMLDDHIAHLKHQLEKTKLHMDQLDLPDQRSQRGKRLPTRTSSKPCKSRMHA